MKPKPRTTIRRRQPRTQVSSRGYLYAACMNTRTRCSATNRIIRLAVQWWTDLISQPKLTSLVMNCTLLKAASGVGW